jgi:energy-coupling factor transport system ATP-binding protein
MEWISMKEKGIEIRDLKVKYPSQNGSLNTTNRTYVLDDINLNIASGEFVVISGFTGAGKTTLLSCLNGVAKHYYRAQIEGNIIINGKRINSLQIGTLSNILGTLLQDIEAQVFNLRVEDEVAFGCENLGLSEEEITRRVDKYCDILQIDPKAEIENLSLGQKQRVLTASVLAMEQDILLLDEPLANLDIKTARTILQYLRGLAEDQNKIIIIIEHRIDLVLPYLTRLIWIKEGKIKEDMDDKQAYEHYHKYFKVNIQQNPHSSTDVLFQLRKCDLGYKNNIVLQNVDLKIYKNDIIIIVGDNGSGKTTLLKSLSGLIKHRDGELWKHSSLRKNRFEKMGYVYQNPNYQLFMDSVYKEFEFQTDEALIDTYLNLFGISHLKFRHPFTLSEGEKRLVTIAIMASMEPQVLLLDEPTIGQDSKNLIKLLSTLKKIQHEKGTSIIIVTHDIRCATALGNRVLWLKDGTIYKEGDNSLINQYFENNYKLASLNGSQS